MHTDSLPVLNKILLSNIILLSVCYEIIRPSNKKFQKVMTPFNYLQLLAEYTFWYNFFFNLLMKPNTADRSLAP